MTSDALDLCKVDVVSGVVQGDDCQLCRVDEGLKLPQFDIRGLRQPLGTLRVFQVDLEIYRFPQIVAI